MGVMKLTDEEKVILGGVYGLGVRGQCSISWTLGEGLSGERMKPIESSRPIMRSWKVLWPRQ